MLLRGLSGGGNPFLLAGTFYGPNPQETSEVRRLAQLGILDAFDFFPPPLNEEKVAFFESRKCGVVSLLAAATEPLKKYAALETKGDADRTVHRSGAIQDAAADRGAGCEGMVDGHAGIRQQRSLAGQQIPPPARRDRRRARIGWTITATWSLRRPTSK